MSDGVRSSSKPRVVVAGLGDAGVLVATRLARTCDVVGISTRPALVSGQELGTRLTDPQRWRRNSFVHYRRFRKLDRVRLLHGKVTSVNFEERHVGVELADGSTVVEPYDVFVIATGASNGFWRHDRVEDVAAIEADLAATVARFADAKTIAIVGGGPTGVSVADNLARSGHNGVHLFHSGDQPLPGYHPSARTWIVDVLQRDGVRLHPNHRALAPQGAGDQLTPGPIQWSSGQESFDADLVMWAVGAVRPHSDFLPREVLDDDGFVRVDQHLRVVGHEDVFAVGDVAASDPQRSSARNWGWKVVIANARAYTRGDTTKLKRYSAPEFRWGSIVGVQADGLVVVQPNGKRFRVPRRFAESVLIGVFVRWYLYGGLRNSQ